MADSTGSRAADPRAPRVSIVIPTLGSPLLLRCLESLRRNIGPAIPHEIVVVANGPAAARAADVTDVASPLIRLVRSAANLGFGGGCNLGGAGSAAEYLVFLNDDIEVLPGWLEALVETADKYPDVGAVGSLILFPDGTIQESGSIAWRDGSTQCISRGASLEANVYNFVRSVHLLFQTVVCEEPAVAGVPWARYHPHGTMSGSDHQTYDPTNFWFFNAACCVAMLDSVGFSDIEIVSSNPHPFVIRARVPGAQPGCPPDQTHAPWS